MSAEAIARVIADLRTGNVRDDAALSEGWMLNSASGIATHGPVVDVTGVYGALSDRDRIDPYADYSCVSPAWDVASICFQARSGEVLAACLSARDLKGDPVLRDHYESGWMSSKATDRLIDWERVRWEMQFYSFVADPHGFGVMGPVQLQQQLVYEDGQLADGRAVHLDDRLPKNGWDEVGLVVLGALNFCNCRNVELVEPIRPRHERKRIARTGVTVSEINVFPTGKSVRSAKGERQGGTPLTSVRGHFACYGEQYGRGLLFGKYSGRFWIPQHARGEREHGEVTHDYTLRASS